MIGHFLRFFVALFSVIGKFSKVGSDIVKNLPGSVYLAKQQVGVPKFQRYVVCKRCHSIYTLEECIEGVGSGRKSRYCTFKRFPSHPHLSMRSQCGTKLLKTVELVNKQIYFYPFLMYCYLGLDRSLQSLFNRPGFYNDCEQWRYRCRVEGELSDVYDGKIWLSFEQFEGKPFLCEAGNLGLILNFDFFQPYDHLSYSLGAIYMSVLNLPRQARFKRENAILVGLIPGPHEPDHDINTFLTPLVRDLNNPLGRC